jgi:hypothetical protein
MKAEDMGIDPHNGEHTRDMTKAETAMMGALMQHHDKDNKIPAEDLAVQWRERIGYLRPSYNEYQRRIEIWKREVRSMVNHLVIDHDQPILSKAGPDGGYWIAKNQAEVDEFYETFRRRAMTGLTKAARGKQAVLADMVKQLTFEFEDLKTPRPALAAKVRPGMEPAPVVMVSSFLDKMTKEPEKYANELKLLRDKFGKVLLPKEMFGEIQDLSQRLSGLLDKVA